MNIHITDTTHIITAVPVKQEDSKGSEESKGGLDRCSVRGD